jgi:hypothetical protein
MGFAIALMPLLAACPQRTAVWVEPGSTAAHLTIGVGKKRGQPGGADIGVVRVYRCDGAATGEGAMWAVGPSSGTGDVRQIVYGQTPAGFVSNQGPQPLTPGCYRIDVSGTGKTEFQVGNDGTVTERQRGRA